MSARIPRKRKIQPGHGDPKFCSCAACKAILRGEEAKAQEMPEVAFAPVKKAAGGPFPSSNFPHGTLEFSARGFCGYYNLAGEWISTSSHHFAGRL